MEVIVIKDGKELKLGADINLNIRWEYCKSADVMSDI
jgi:hypothetical protein